jgi:prepilin-type N-terminal cleavage/methylation domain-containing protein
VARVGRFGSAKPAPGVECVTNRAALMFKKRAGATDRPGKTVRAPGAPAWNRPWFAPLFERAAARQASTIEGMYEPSHPMRGITLIELSVALSILALLAAVLLPRIAQLQRSARIGELRYLHGIVSARVTLVHIAATLRQGVPDTKPCAGGRTADNQVRGAGTVCAEHGLVATLHGYPADGQSLGLTPAELPTERYRVRQEGGKTVFLRADANDPEACGFTYFQALDATTAAAISVPVTSGC